METKVKIGLICMLIIAILLISGCVQERPEEIVVMGEPYIDVELSDLSPEHDGKRICLYGNFSIGFEHIGFEHLVWVEPNLEREFISPEMTSKIVFILPEKEYGPRMAHYGRSIGCGILNYSLNYSLKDIASSKIGYGQEGMYPYLLKVDVLTDAKDEKSYKGTLSKPTDCEKIPGTKRRGICYWDFAILTNKYRTCESIEDKAIKNFCYLHLAKILQEPKICQEIPQMFNDTIYQAIWSSSAAIKDICYVVSTTDNIEWCDKILDRGMKDKCLAKVAFNTNSKDICDEIDDENSDKKFCYADLAVKLNDLSICEDLPEGNVELPGGGSRYISTRSECYWAYVARTQKYSVCNKVREGWRGSCLTIESFEKQPSLIRIFARTPGKVDEIANLQLGLDIWEIHENYVIATAQDDQIIKLKNMGFEVEILYETLKDMLMLMGNNVTITTDKKKYKQGGEVRITIQNNLNQDVSLSTTYLIQQMNFNFSPPWNTVEILGAECDCGVECGLATSEIFESGQTKSLIWDQTIGYCDFKSGKITETSAEVGVYRIEGYYCPMDFCPVSISLRRTIHSDEFIINPP